MKTKLILLFCLLAYSSSFSQDCVLYFPNTEGTTLKYNTYDKKDKLTGSYTHSVKDIMVNGAKTTAKIDVSYYDKNDEKTYENELDVWCEKGVFYIDMENYLSGESMAAYEQMEVKVDASDLNIPSKLKVGDELAEGVLKMTISNNGMQLMTMTTTVENRKVEAKESVTTDAGTFECYKISSTINSRTIMSISMKSIEWFSPGIGMIKSESYNSSDKLTGKTELVSIKK